MRALLIVHDPPFAAVLESVLARRGWRVDRACADSALQTYRRDPARLVVLQENEQEQAYSVCRALRQDPIGIAAYILGLANGGSDAAFRALLDAGADDVIALPCGQRELEMRMIVAEGRIGSPSPATGPDIVERLGEIHQQYHIQKAFLEGLVEHVPEGIVMVDAGDRVLRINREFTRLFGYTPDEAVGRGLNELIVPEELREEGYALDEGVRRGERVMRETIRRDHAGHRIEVSVLATRIDVNGPVGAFWIYRDISEKKRQEAALRESEARYRALFDQSPVGVFLCDEDLRITECNEYLTRIVGLPYEAIVGSDLRSLRNGRLLPGLKAALRGEPAFYEGPYRGRSGKQLHVSVQYAPLREADGAVIGGIGVLEDISDRLLAHKQLRAHAAEMERVNFALRDRTLQLEAAMQARSRLYSAMNHELRTPISAVMLYQELMIAGSLGPLNEEQKRALEHSHTATRHLLDLVRDILDLSKIEAGKVTVEPKTVCLKTLLTELLASMTPLTERYGSELRLHIAPDAGEVVTDPQRVRQILMNFVSNAAKYGRGKPIDLRCRRHRGLGEVLLEVVDRGIGIAHEDLENIFDEFVQLGVARDDGTGLGLAISRRLADLLEARLEVESEPEVGSVFRLVLPVAVDYKAVRAAGAA